jgi:hypothetical protein
LPALTAKGLRRSLQGSLRRLAVERVDILLLHEPTMQRLPNPQELLDELQKMQLQGVIKRFGLAGSLPAMAPIVAHHPALATIVQAGELEWMQSGQIIPDITFGAIARGPHRAFSPDVDNAVACDNLRTALARRPNGVVLVSTTNREHLRQLAQVTAEPAS